MSASLVGSEMCIRDSRTLAVEVATTKARFLAVVAHAPCVSSAFTLEAVSYTHLTLPTICSV
eukprot:3426765-Alexandrium_andersonii.AAC.1